MANAVTYAEAELGVHATYQEARLAAKAANQWAERLIDTRSKIRSCESDIQVREFEIMDEEWSKHPDMPVTRMDKHVKAAQMKDSKLQELHRVLRSLKNDADDYEARKAGCDTEVKIHTARLYELGGYLQYLAEAKAAQRVRENRSTPE